MGVYITLNILPNKIGKKEWENVYGESLKLIQGYSFMDSSVDVETYGIQWQFVHRTEEREMEHAFGKKSRGWHVFGDYKTMLAAESFGLFRDIEIYRNGKNDHENCDDILAELINNKVYYNQEHQQIPVNSIDVFNNKTQGFPHHIYLLGIACLIESRFPKYAAIEGDVSIGQMKKAIDWANSILENPIYLTERADNLKVLDRISSIVQDEFVVLKSFMGLTMHGEDFRLGEFIREQFNTDTICAYFTNQFREYDVETLGFHSILTDFFHLGFSIEMACEICVLNSKGCQYDAEIFAEAVLSMQWPKEKGDLSNETHLDLEPYRTTPDTVDSQFGEIILKMAGVQESVRSNISYEEVKDVLQAKLGKLVDITELLKNNEKNYDEAEDSEIDKLISQLEENMNKLTPESTAYTISDLDNLILWEKGDTLHPTIEKELERLKEFVNETIGNNSELYAEFHSYDDHTKVKKLIQLNRYFYLRKETWDYYIDHIHQTDLIDTLYGILVIKADERNANKLCKAVINNVSLLKEYVLSRG